MDRLFLGEVTQDFPREELVDFFVPWNGLSGGSFWIVINVVFTSMANENDTCRFKAGYQVASFHASSSSSTRLIPGIFPSVKVS